MRFQVGADEVGADVEDDGVEAIEAAVRQREAVEQHDVGAHALKGDLSGIIVGAHQPDAEAGGHREIGEYSGRQGVAVPGQAAACRPGIGDDAIATGLKVAQVKREGGVLRTGVLRFVGHRAISSVDRRADVDRVAEHIVDLDPDRNLMVVSSKDQRRRIKIYSRRGNDFDRQAASSHQLVAFMDGIEEGESAVGRVVLRAVPRRRGLRS